MSLGPCAFPGCTNGEDPRWGGWCDGHGPATEEQATILARRIFERGRLAGLEQAAQLVTRLRFGMTHDSARAMASEIRALASTPSDVVVVERAKLSLLRAHMQTCTISDLDDLHELETLRAWLDELLGSK